MNRKHIIISSYEQNILKLIGCSVIYMFDHLRLNGKHKFAREPTLIDKHEIKQVIRERNLLRKYNMYSSIHYLFIAQKPPISSRNTPRVTVNELT